MSKRNRLVLAGSLVFFVLFMSYASQRTYAAGSSVRTEEEKKQAQDLEFRFAKQEEAVRRIEYKVDRVENIVVDLHSILSEKELARKKKSTQTISQGE